RYVFQLLSPMQPHAPAMTYPLSLHDALPIYSKPRCARQPQTCKRPKPRCSPQKPHSSATRWMRKAPTFLFSSSIWNAPSKCTKRSEEHTSELQSRSDLVCRLLLEKKKNTL